MGLLDDAIREHLELKRRRGVDPSMVAREQQEALAPVFPQEAGPDETDAEPAGEPADAAADALYVHDSPAADHQPPADVVPLDGHFTHDPVLAQETAELDMESVIAEQPGEGEADGPPTPPDCLPFE